MQLNFLDASPSITTEQAKELDATTAKLTEQLHAANKLIDQAQYYALATPSKRPVLTHDMRLLIESYNARFGRPRKSFEVLKEYDDGHKILREV